MSTLERAIEIAASAHANQVDKAGESYILHPIRVMLKVKTMEQQITAVLHDVVEDTHWTIKELAAEGFAPEVLDAITALTKLDGESRIDAAKRTARNSIATQVKRADVADNMDLKRIPNPTEKDYARIEEYEEVLKILSAEVAV